MKISVLGIGYLGYVHAAYLAAIGHEVIGIDTDAARISFLHRGELPFQEAGLAQLQLQAGKRLQFSTDYRDAATAQAHFICVGTPQLPNGAGMDLKQLQECVDALLPHLTGRHVIFGKSTVPPGTTASLYRRMQKQLCSGESAVADIHLAWNPEFLSEGNAVFDSRYPQRLVIGALAGEAGDIARACAREIYAAQIAAGVPVVETNWESAELIKLSANAFLATKLSFMQGVAQLAEGTGADIAAITTALGLDSRIGQQYLHAGIGFGGGCLPKDLQAFIDLAQQANAPEVANLGRSVADLNSGRLKAVIGQALAANAGSLKGVQVAILGAAFKPGTNDCRESPGLLLAAELQLLGAEVRIWDPLLKDLPQLITELPHALNGAQLAITATAHDELLQANPHELMEFPAKPVLIDANRCLDTAKWVAAGWRLL
ncbi:UDP-glucose dehydrogenase family protein [Corynebacterium caspium]|uniref:UDP-glucose dehydrogenase family protein n=1 Tax=Corynebacterium caspium TaxID=234828 RepID=UPI0003631F84|nr:nucleotide sugar dehydrogenase [Corynebacterium caspium]WKD59678.1 UDP-glucose 6-dehydrogenase TuaD [Corynebacterium caspium DSM 44850]